MTIADIRTTAPTAARGAVRGLYAGAAGSPIRAMLALAGLPDMVSLAGGHPDPALLPSAWVNDGLRTLAEDARGASLQYAPTEGLPALREAGAALLRDRGIPATTDEVLVTTGSQQGIDLLGRVLLDAGDVVALAAFNYPAAVQSLRFSGARFAPVDGDTHGLRTDLLEAALARSGARVLYVVPNFANPTAELMPLQRRLELLDIAARRDVTLIEDDPYGDLWFDAPPPPSLAALNHRAGAPARVVHLTSFSKTVAPALRLGVLRAPADIARAVVIAKQAADIHSGTIEQRLLTAMLADGRLAAHLAAVRAAYAGKRDVFVQALRERCDGLLAFEAPAGGMFVWARTAPGVPLLDGDAWQAFGRRHGVLVLPGAAFSLDAAPQPWLRLSFANPSSSQLAVGAARLGAGLAALAASTSAPH